MTERPKSNRPDPGLPEKKGVLPLGARPMRDPSQYEGVHPPQRRWQRAWRELRRTIDTDEALQRGY